MKANPLRKLHAMDQSIWFDYFRRDLISRGNGAFANMKPTVAARLCSLPHRRRQYVSVDSLQRYGFRARIANCLSCATSRFAGSSRGSATTEWFPHGKRSVSYATPHKMRRWRDYVVALHGCDGATNRGQRPVCGRCLLSICRGDAAFIRRRRQL